MSKLPTRRQIEAFARQYPQYKEIAELANARRKHLRQTAAARNKKPKRKRKSKDQLRPTDYLDLDQVARLMRILPESNNHNHRTRAALNRMLIITMAETGLRVSEICDLRLKCLPCFHGHAELEVIDGKGEKSRTVGISDLMARTFADYVERYHRRGSPESYLFASEGGGRLSRGSVYGKIKRMGIKMGLWTYRQDGVIKTKLSPHKFRHTSATHGLAATGNIIFVKDQLGHAKTDTTNIYAKTQSEQRKKDADRTSKRLWSKVPGGAKSMDLAKP